MTFTLPEGVANRLLKRVPARERSHYVADALAQKLRDRESRLVRSCDAANQSAAVRTVEREFDAIEDAIAEPWHDSATR